MQQTRKRDHACFCASYQCRGVWISRKEWLRHEEKDKESSAAIAGANVFRAAASGSSTSVPFSVQRGVVWEKSGHPALQVEQPIFSAPPEIPRAHTIASEPSVLILQEQEARSQQLFNHLLMLDLEIEKRWRATWSALQNLAPAAAPTSVKTLNWLIREEEWYREVLAQLYATRSLGDPANHAQILAARLRTQSHVDKITERRKEVANAVESRTRSSDYYDTSE